MAASFERILEASTSCPHFLEFQRPGERRPGQTIGRFLGGALKKDGVAIAIASERTAAGILNELARMGTDPVASMRNGSLVLIDSSEMLARFFNDGVLDSEQFDRTTGAAVRDARARAGDRPLRAFGDMVGVLWLRGEREAAVQLERLWNALQQHVNFALYCTYPIDVFSGEFSAERLDGVFETHTHVFPSASSSDLGRALDMAMDDVLGVQAKDVRSRLGSKDSHAFTSMPKSEQTILWLRSHLPDVCEAVLRRARDLYDRGAPRVYLR